MNWQAEILDFSQAPLSTNNYTTNCQIIQSHHKEELQNNLEPKARIYEMRLARLKTPARKFGGRMYDENSAPLLLFLD